MSKIKFAIAAATLALIGSANAATFSNTATGSIQPFGSPDTTSYGETFVVGASETLQSWSFFFNSGSAGNLKYVVAAWNGAEAVGPALVTAAGSYDGSTEAVTFSGLNTTLAAGTYISYVTVAGVSSPVSGVYASGSGDNGGLGGSFFFLNSGGTDPLTLSEAWSGNWTPSNLTYSATFGVSAVPEPASVALLLAGLGIVGLARRRAAKSL